MRGLIGAIRDGDWVAADRLRVYPPLLIVLVAAATVFVLVGNGGLLPNGAPFGSDFVSFWVAAREAVAGNAHVPYDRTLFEPAQRALFPHAGYFAFFYPPHYLAMVLPLGVMPYHAALGAWLAAGFAAAGWVLTAITGRARDSIVLGLAFPAAFLTIAHGQNAFLSAALFGGALVLLPTRPVVAGVLFGLLTFKPQLGLLIPLALLAAGQWRAIVSAGLTLAASVLVSTALFGIDIWRDFFAQSGHAMETLQRGLVDWEKMISLYAALRVAGLPDAVAMTAHVAAALGVAAIVALAWLPRLAVPLGTRAALLLTGALIATPFGLNYDLYLLAPAGAFLIARGLGTGFLPYEKSALAVMFVVPVAMPAMVAAGIAIMPVLLLIMFGLVAQRALIESASAVPAPAE